MWQSSSTRLKVFVASCFFLAANGQIRTPGSEGRTELSPRPNASSTCNRPTVTDLTDEREAMTQRCPNECKFIARSASFACSVMCVKAEECGKRRIGFGFANESSLVCEHCAVEGCLDCLSQTACRTCHDGFVLKNSRCVFQTDVFFDSLVFMLLLSVVVPLVAGIIYLSCTCNERRFRTTWLKHAPSGTQSGFLLQDSTGSFKSQVVQVARKHHHWCKIRPWYSSNDEAEQVPRLLSLCTNLHRKYVVGLGMTLYYNFMLFMFAFFLLLFLVHRLYGLMRMDRLSEGGLRAFAEKKGNSSQCVQLLENKQGEAEEDIDLLRSENVWQFALLYFVGLIATIAFAAWQKDQARRFLLEHKTMRMHAVSVVGFPPDATDEFEVKRFLEKEFERLLGRPIELAYVSICYDTQSFGGDLETLLDRLVTIEDVRRGAYGPGLADVATEAQGIAEAVDSNQMSRAEWLEVATQHFEERVKRLFGTHGLKNAGEVFAVFSRVQDCADVLAGVSNAKNVQGFFVDIDKRPSMRRIATKQLRYECRSEPLLADTTSSAEMVGLDVNSVRVEPVNIGWFHYGLPRKTRIFRCVRALVFIFCFIALLDRLILAQSVRYMLEYTSKTESEPGGMGSKVFGILIGTANWLICIFLGTMITTSGFLRQDREEVLIFAVFTTVCVFNTAVNIYIAHQKAVLSTSIIRGDPSFLDAATMDADMRVAEEIVAMLFPGSFVPCLMWPLQGFIWPFLQGLITLWFSHSDSISARSAERTLEPLPIGLAWDCQGSITTPVLGLTVMFCYSNLSQNTLLYLAAWAIFFYCLQHFTHLRLVKTAFTTSNRLDSALLHGWGVVLGELAAASAFWGMQAHNWHWGVVPAAWLGGCVLHWILLWLVVDPLVWADRRKKQDTRRGMPRDISWIAEAAAKWGASESELEDTKNRLLYDWANCNPVLVLKSQVVDLKKAGIPPLWPYVVGKTHSWEAWRRLSQEEPPLADQLWYEPGRLYNLLGVTL